MMISHALLSTPLSRWRVWNSAWWLWKYAGPRPASTERLPKRLSSAAVLIAAACVLKDAGLFGKPDSPM